MKRYLTGIFLLEWLHKLPVKKSAECKVWFRHDGRRHQLRLCAMRKSRLAAENAQRKARSNAKDRGSEIQPETLEYAQYVMVLCSADKTEISRDAVLGLYRGR